MARIYDEKIEMVVTLDEESKELLRAIVARLSVELATEATGDAKRLIEHREMQLGLLSDGVLDAANIGAD